MCATSQAAQKLNPEGDGGFNPRVKPNEPTGALAPEQWHSFKLNYCRNRELLSRSKLVKIKGQDEAAMISATIFEAKTNLSSLVKQAQKGEIILITSGRARTPSWN